MKTIKYIYVIMISFLLIGLSSCEVANDLDEYDPLFKLPAEGAISNEGSAELALAGVYAAFRQSSSGSGTPELFLIPSVLSGTMARSPFSGNQETLSWQQNNPIVVNTRSNLGAYTRMYDLINRVNWLLEQIADVSEDNFPTPGRKAGIIAEARALRATANFYLLRLWGQFYDTNSEYGITLRTEPARSDEAFPRNTVAETYDAIIADLDDAIANAPDLRAKFYTSNVYAKALKSKVLLYMGDYVASAALAKDVLDNSGSSFELAATYQEIFDNTTPALFDSSEVIFGSKGEPGAGLGIGNFTDFFVSLDPAYTTFGAGSWQIGTQTINYDNDRISSMVELAFGFIPATGKFNRRGIGDQYEMVYHMRMAELHLIYAEADARATNSVSADALAALNAVRTRAGATTTGGDGFETYPATITYAEFIEAVRLEKYVELGAESGEEWFDLVRYHFVDGFDVTTVKPSATNSDKYILPIDQTTIEVGGNVVIQNPSY